MKQKTRSRILAVVVTLASVFTAHQLIKRFLFEDTHWIYATPDWVFAGTALLVAVGCMWALWVWLFAGAAVDTTTKRMIRRALED